MLIYILHICISSSHFCLSFDAFSFMWSLSLSRWREVRSRKKKKTKCKQSCIWFYLYIQYKRNKPNRTKPNRNEACNNSLADFKNFIAYVDVVDSIVVTAVLSLSTLFPLAFPLNKTHTRRVATRHWTNKMKMRGNFSLFLCSSLTLYWLINVQYWRAHQSSARTIPDRLHLSFVTHSPLPLLLSL